MLSLYDLSCNRLRDPRELDVAAPIVLSWRLGSSRPGARQTECRVVVTSVDEGACRWDTGWVASEANEVVYAGDPLSNGETCVWFAMARDEAGEEACGVPSSFSVAMDPEGAGGTVCELGPQRMAFVWTSDAALDAELERSGASRDPRDPVWRELVGLELDGDHARIAPNTNAGLARGLRFVQGSVLASRGLVLVRWERGQDEARLMASLPPGMTGVAEWGGERRVLASGRHELRRNA